LRRKRQGSCRSPGRNGPVVGTVRNAARAIPEKLAATAADILKSRPGTVAGSDAPAVFPVPLETARILDGIASLNAGRASAVLEVIDPLLPHIRVANFTEIN